MMKATDYIWIIVFLVVLFLLFLWYHYYSVCKICNTKESLDIFTIKSKNSIENHTNPFTVLIVAGTHGNEPAGSLSVRKLLDRLTTNNLQLKSGQLVLVPKVNHCGLQMNSRFIPFVWDLNRQYPKSQEQGEKMINRSKTINDAICGLVKDAHFVLDFHEGWSFHAKDKNSVGSTLIPTTRSKPKELSLKIINKLNENIEHNKRFMIMTDEPDLVVRDSAVYGNNEEIKGTLRYYCDMLGKDYILVETTGQDNVQPLELRTAQCDIIINQVLEQFGMI